MCFYTPEEEAKDTNLKEKSISRSSAGKKSSRDIT